MSQGLDRFHSRYVYRVMRTDEDPNSDITCSDPLSQRTLCEHVESGLRQPSRFISTSAKLSDALKWMKKANEKSSLRYALTRNVIVKIDVDLLKSKHPRIAETAYDLSDVLNREKYLRTKQQKGYSAAYNEVVFRDVIPAEAVSIEYSGLVRDTERSVKLLQSVSNKSQTEVTSKSITLQQNPKSISTIKSAPKAKNNIPSEGHLSLYGRAASSDKIAPYIAPIKSQQIPFINPGANLSNRTPYVSSPLDNLVQIIKYFTT